MGSLFTCEALGKDPNTKFVAIDQEQHNDWGDRALTFEGHDTIRS